MTHSIDHPCTRCGGRATQSFGERAAGARLLWFESWNCDGCGPISEADGAERLPDELRAAVLAAEGAFRVHVRPVEKLAMIRTLRDDFGLPLQEASSTFGRLPGVFGQHLTRAEAEVLANRFSPRAATVTIEREA